jgi:hypothetical protein
MKHKVKRIHLVKRIHFVCIGEPVLSNRRARLDRA